MSETAPIQVVGGPMAAYQRTFGFLPDGTRYQDGLKGIDMRSQAQVKAMGPTAGGSGTASSTVLVPIYQSQAIVDISRKYTPLREILPRVTNLGLAAVYNRITAKGSAVTANADAALTEADDTYAQVSVAIKYLYSVGRVLGPMDAAVPGYSLDGFQPMGSGMTSGNPFSTVQAPNAMQLEVLNKTRALFELEESLLVNGDASTDATEFSGIVKLQGTTNQNDLSGADMTWDDVEDTVRMAFEDGGRPKVAIASPSAVVKLRKIMIDTFRWSPGQGDVQSVLGFGVPTGIVIQSMVGPIVVIPSQYLSDTSGQRSIYFLDTDFIEVRVLQDVTFEPLAKINDSRKFMLKCYECLIMRAPEFNSFLDNIL